MQQYPIVCGLILKYFEDFQSDLSLEAFGILVSSEINVGETAMVYWMFRH
jgi:hypothetical protein